jgi:hypothetical protein
VIASVEKRSMLAGRVTAPIPNRRRYHRVKAKQLVARVRSGPQLHIGLGIENISMGGIFIRCTNPLKPGSLVTLELSRAGDSLIAIAGQVTSMVSATVANERKVSPGMGIAFDELAPALIARLEGLIREIDPQAVLKRVSIPPPKRSAPPPARKPVASTARTEQIPALTLPPNPSNKLQLELETLRATVLTRQRKINELLLENKQLRERIRDLGG